MEIALLTSAFVASMSVVDRSGRAVVAERPGTDTDAGQSGLAHEPRITFLVDSPAFWEALRTDLATARDYAYFQTYLPRGTGQAQP